MAVGTPNDWDRVSEACTDMYRFGTLGLGTTLYVFMILSGYSSLIFDTRRVPMPGMVRLVFDMCQQISVHLKIAETAYGRFQEP